MYEIASDFKTLISYKITWDVWYETKTLEESFLWRKYSIKGFPKIMKDIDRIDALHDGNRLYLASSLQTHKQNSISCQIELNMIMLTTFRIVSNFSSKTLIWILVPNQSRYDKCFQIPYIFMRNRNQFMCVWINHHISKDMIFQIMHDKINFIGFILLFDMAIIFWSKWL